VPGNKPWACTVRNLGEEWLQFKITIGYVEGDDSLIGEFFHIQLHGFLRDEVHGNVGSSIRPTKGWTRNSRKALVNKVTAKSACMRPLID